MKKTTVVIIILSVITVLSIGFGICMLAMRYAAVPALDTQSAEITPFKSSETEPPIVTGDATVTAVTPPAPASDTQSATTAEPAEITVQTTAKPPETTWLPSTTAQTAATSAPATVTEPATSAPATSAPATSAPATTASNNRHAEFPAVTVEVDGVPVEPWHEVLYRTYSGVVSNGAGMFEQAPRKSIYKDLPTFEMKDGLKITVDGTPKTTVRIGDITPMLLRSVDYPTEGLAKELGKGEFIVYFTATNYGTGNYGRDCIVEDYYFIVRVTQTAETTAKPVETTAAPLQTLEIPKVTDTPAASPVVTVKVDGKEVEPWSAVLYSSIGGLNADGKGMFEAAPRKSILNELPVFDMKDGIQIIEDGVEQTAVTIGDITPMTMRKIEYPTAGLAKELGKGEFIVRFVAKNSGSGKYASDSIAYEYYFIVRIGETAETTAAPQAAATTAAPLPAMTLPKVTDTPAAPPEVVITVDGKEVEAWSEELYRITAGNRSDGFGMFVPAPRKSSMKSYPRFTLSESLKITVNGEELKVVNVSDTMPVSLSHLDYYTSSLATDVAKGNHLVYFTALGEGTGKYAGDCIAVDYYFIVTIP